MIFFVGVVAWLLGRQTIIYDEKKQMKILFRKESEKKGREREQINICGKTGRRCNTLGTISLAFTPKHSPLKCILPLNHTPCYLLPQADTG